MSAAENTFDEMFKGFGQVRAHYRGFMDWLKACPPEDIVQRRLEAEWIFRKVGVTFGIDGDKEGAERPIPFDGIPRIITAHEWSHIEAGLKQRVSALNAFLHDIYHDRNIVKAGLISHQQLYSNPAFQMVMMGVDLPNRVYAHIAGIDLIRHSDGDYYILEDNLRTPSGVAYMLENRKLMTRLFPELLGRYRIENIHHYPAMLRQALLESSYQDNPVAVLLTPGRFNAAYFEHVLLAQEMGIELVEGADLVVKNGYVYMRTIRGLVRVDVIYRRINDEWLDPLAFANESALGVAGLMAVYRAGRVSIVNAVGSGVADDKSIFPLVPAMIRFYLSEEPILKQVDTWTLSEPADLHYVLAHLHELVVKPVANSGGHGVVIGPLATASELEQLRHLITQNPHAFIAQPTMSLSTCPIYVEKGIAARHVDLRAYVISGRNTWVSAGGLTRVALAPNTLIVNSSQGGGTKDTWVLQAHKEGDLSC